MPAIAIYKFFKGKPFLLIGLVLAAFATTLFFASKIKLEEDINKFIPKDKKIEEINFVLENLKIKDKLVVNIYNADRSSSETGGLMSCADALADSLMNIHGSSYVKDISYKVSDDLMMQVYSTFYQQLPIFLEEKDFERIEHFLQPDSLKAILKNDYKTLISPSSVVFAKFIQKDPLSITALALKKMERLQFDENFEVHEGYIMTKDKKNLMLFINSDVPPNETEKTKLFFESLDNIIHSLNQQFEKKVVIEYYGAPAVSLGNATQIKEDSINTSIIALVLIILLLGIFFRRILVVFYILLPVLFGALFSLTILYFIKGEISAIAVGAGSIVLGIAINYSLHFFTHYKHERSVAQVIKDLTLPMLIGSATTVGAFLSLQFAKSQALHDFGLFAAFSLIGAVLFSILVLPHLLGGDNQILESTESNAKPSFLEKLVDYRFDKNKPIVITAFLLTILFAFNARYVKFESDMLKINYQSEELTIAQQHLDSINDFSLRSVYIVSKGKNLNEALKVNEIVTAKLQALKAENSITKFSSISDIIISDSMQKIRIDRWNSFWTEAKRDSLEQRLINESKPYKFKEAAFSQFYNQLRTNFQPVPLSDLDTLKKLVVNDWITEKEDVTTVVSLVKVEPNLKYKVYDAFEENDSVVVFDKQYMSSQFVEIVSSDFNLILLLTGFLVFGFMLLAHGRIELAFINFLPMFISWIWILGIMGILGLEFNIINIIISTFIFGLGDDYSIFIMDGLGQEYKYGRKNISSYKTSIFLSVLTTIIGIGVLIFAEHPALKSIAAITIIGMITVLLISFIVQPILYNFLILNRKKRKLLPYTFLNLGLTAFGFTNFLIGSILINIAAFFLFYLTPLPMKKKKLFFHYMIQFFCKLELYIFFNVKKKIINEDKADFKKPSILISNHQSHLDLALLLMLNPKLIVFTNDWVWNNRFYGRIVKMADFYPASQGYEAAIEKVRALMKDGYSALIFPEGTRSTTGEILRFHKGAFYLAEQLKVDIQPMLIHGAGDCVTKGDFHFKEGSLTVKYLPRIASDDAQYGITYRDRSKNIRFMMRDEYNLLRQEQETVDYFRPRLLRNYVFKGPVLEWYCKIKVRLEGNYKLFESYLPKQGKITDVGCGYGFLPLMLSFMSQKREVLGVDYDEEKIDIAQNCISKTDKVNFVCADVTQYQYDFADAFIISDVLHYLSEEQQVDLILACANKLNKGGVMIIRDADADKKQRHMGTRYTEFVSTNVGFNKTKEGGLHFTSASLIRKTLESLPFLEFEILDNTKLTSNIIFIIHHK